MSAIQAILISKPPVIFNNLSPHSRRLQFHGYNSSIHLGNFSLSSYRIKYRPFFALLQDNVDSSNNDQNPVPEAQVSEFKEDDNAQVSEEKESLKEKGKWGLFVFLMGFFVKIKIGFEKMLLSDWFSWWPFWRQEKKLELLISEADSNPLDVSKQTALLVELNKHR